MSSGDTVHLQCVPPRAQPEATVRFLKDGQPFIDANGLATTFNQPPAYSRSSSHPSTSINNDEALDGFLFPAGDAERFKLLSDGTLRIHNAQPKDNGRYSCVAENFVDTRESAPALLTVFGKFSFGSVFILKLSKDYFVFLFGNFLLLKSPDIVAVFGRFREFSRGFREVSSI